MQKPGKLAFAIKRRKKTRTSTLIDESAMLQEQAYRRGFEQGFLAALGDDPPEKRQVNYWRHGLSLERAYPGPMTRKRAASVLDGKNRKRAPLTVDFQGMEITPDIAPVMFQALQGN